MDTPTSGRFVWRELITPALEESRTFYSQLFDWAPNAVDMGGPAPYTLFNAGAEQAAGMMAPMMEGAPPAWLDYITVDDVEASRAKVVALGGKTLTEAMDIPGIGRFSVVQDPTGATFALFTSVTPGASPDRKAPTHTFCWSQLMTTNLDRAVPFYAGLFGWDPEPMGDMVAFNRDGKAVASAMVAQMGMPSHWLPYVAVEDCDAAAAKAERLGAQTYVTPTTMPGMGRFSVHADPGGAVIALWKDLSTPAA